MERSKPFQPAELAIETVDQQIAEGFRALRFKPNLEQIYEADGHVERISYLTITTLISLMLYDLFLISDWQMLPDVFFEACVCRLAIFTPYVLISLFFLSRTPSPTIRETLASTGSVVALMLFMVFFVRSASPYRITYHYGIVLMMIFASILQRLRFRYAVAVNIGMVVVQFVGMSQSSVFDAQMMQSDIVFFVSTAILVLLANYLLEWETRRGYLMALRSTLLNVQLDRNAKLDPLTGLWNRRHLSSLMETAWAEAAVAPKTMAVILIDIDHFKLFNDTYGHLDGDMCLGRIGRCLRDIGLDGREAVVRFGGEEFLVFVPGLDKNAARILAERLLEAVRREAIAHPVVGTDAIVTASLGVAVGQAPSVAPSALIAAADKALYRAKDAGRDCFRFFDDPAPNDMALNDTAPTAWTDASFV